MQARRHCRQFHPQARHLGSAIHQVQLADHIRLLQLAANLHVCRQAALHIIRQGNQRLQGRQIGKVCGDLTGNIVLQKINLGCCPHITVIGPIHHKEPVQLFVFQVSRQLRTVPGIYVGFFVGELVAQLTVAGLQGECCCHARKSGGFIGLSGIQANIQLAVHHTAEGDIGF